MGLVKVRMLTKGPNKNYKVDEIVEVDEARAARLLEGMYATEDLAKGVKWQHSSGTAAKSTTTSTT